MFLPRSMLRAILFISEPSAIGVCKRVMHTPPPPTKLDLAISLKEPHHVLGSSSTCVAGALGSYNHAIGLMYLFSHFYMTKAKVIPDDLACTSLPQQWNNPRGKKTSYEPLMDMVFKKPRLDLVVNSGTSTKTHLEFLARCTRP